MATVISGDSLERYNVGKYNFKVFSHGSNSSEVQEQQEEEQVYTKNDNPAQRESDIDSSAMSQSSKDALIESLMKKTDEMSSNFIKLQMKLEDKEQEYKGELLKIKEQSFSEGVAAGREQAKKDSELNMQQGVSQFSNSVTALEKSAQEFETALEGIKNSLVSAAVDISHEVINIELGENSASIAEVLSKELIKELQSASKITLKVNPNDHGSISQNVGSLEHVEIISDSAVSRGGVIAISDAGNIDSQISKRFERVKKAALSE